MVDMVFVLPSECPAASLPGSDKLCCVGRLLIVAYIRKKRTSKIDYMAYDMIRLAFSHDRSGYVRARASLAHSKSGDGPLESILIDTDISSRRMH